MKNNFTKILSIIIVMGAFMVQTNLQAQWAKNAVSGVKGNYGYGIAVDGSGNSYLIGRYDETTDFDPSDETHNLGSVGDSYDIFFAKYDSDGNFVWAHGIGSIKTDYGYSIAVDEAGGVYITGHFDDDSAVDFDPGAEEYLLTAAGEYDIFFAKYSTTDGSFIWAKNVGGVESVNAYRIQVVEGNVYIVGRFEKISVDFDPDGGTHTPSSILSNVGLYDIFFAKYSATDGSYVWAKSIGTTSTEYAYDMVVDGSGNVHIVGIFLGTMDFDPDDGTENLTSAGERDVFFAKYSSVDGSYIWAKNVGTSGSSDAQDYGYGIAVDVSGNVYITGRFEGTGDYDPGPGTENISSLGGYDAFIAKYNSSGDYVWANSVGSASDTYGNSITTDGTNVYVTGKYKDTGNFGTNGATINHTSQGNWDIWLGKYNASTGASVWVNSIGGTEIDEQAQYGAAISLGSVHITGYFYGTSNFDATTTLTSAGSCDAFNAKYTDDGALPVELTTFSAKINGNTVNLAWETATEVNNYGFNVERKLETANWSEVAFVEGSGNSNSVKRYSFTDNVSVSGKYSYRLKQVDIDGTFEYSNVVEVTVGIPQEFSVAQNYPNPFNPTTTISFALPSKENVQVVVYNSLGEIVKTLVNGNLEAGVHTYNFDASDLGSGIYFYKVTAGVNVQTQKMILLK